MLVWGCVNVAVFIKSIMFGNKFLSPDGKSDHKGNKSKGNLMGEGKTEQLIDC